MTKFFTALGGALPMLAAAMAAPASAQEAQQPAQAERQFEEDEIVVTARRREERLQDVAVAVTAVQGQSLEQLGSTRFEDVRLPAVRIGQGGFTDSLFIRGIGSGNNQGFEQSAPIFIDGAWYGSSRTARLAFLDLDRIEVLKGPQSTFFGKNAIAGAVSLATRAPTSEFEAGLDATYEFNQQETTLFGFVSGPLGDNVRARLAVQARDLDEGWLYNTATGTDDPQQEALVGRLSLQWDVTDDLLVSFKLEDGHTQQWGRETQLFACNPASNIINFALEDCQLNDTRAVAFNPARFGVALNIWDTSRPFPEYSELDMRTAQLRADWELAGGYLLNAQVDFIDQFAYQSTIPSHQTNPRTIAQLVEDSQGLSQEIRLTSPDDDAFSWTVGVYHDRGFLNSFPTVGLPIVLNGRVNQAGVDQNHETWSAFGEGVLDFAEAWRVRVGARWSETEKWGLGQRRTYQVTPSVGAGANPPPPIPTTISLLPTAAQGTFGIDFDRRDESFDPSVTLEYRPRDGQLFFIGWRQGFKAGGIDHNLGSFGATVTDLETANQFEPEEVDYYEAGARLSLFDRRMTLNGTLFRGEYANLQVATYDVDLGLFRTINAAQSISQGAEIEVAYRLTQDLRVNLAVNYLDSFYEDFSRVTCYSNPPQTVAEGCITIAPGVTAQDRSGDPTQFSPEFSGNARILYERGAGFDLFGGPTRFSAQLDWLFTSSYFTDNFGDPDTEVEGFSKFDARLALGSENDGWELALIGRNLTDETVPVWIGNQVAGGQNSSHFAITDRPRQVAIQARLRY